MLFRLPKRCHANEYWKQKWRKQTAAQSSEKLCMPFNQVVLNDLVFFHKEKQDVKSLTDLMRSAFDQIKEQLILFLLLFVRFGFGFGFGFGFDLDYSVYHKNLIQ